MIGLPRPAAKPTVRDLLVALFDLHDVVCLGATPGCAAVRASDRVGNSAHLADEVLKLLNKEL